MAKLEDLLPKLKITSESTVVLEKKLSGRKRRLWIEDDEDSLNKPKQDREKATFADNIKTKKIVENNNTKPSSTLLSNFSEPSNGKGSIKEVYKPDSSSRLINHIHNPLIEKGSIKEFYKPDSLSLADLRGNPLKLIRFIHELVKKENDGNKTRRIKLKEIMKQFDISKDSARTALRFLLKQKLIFRIEFHPGQLGWSRYEIKKSMYEEIEKAIEIGLIDPLILKEFLDISKGFINSSSNIYNITTNDKGGQLPEEWLNINTEPLKEQGFSITQLKQLHALNITSAEIVQESINHFAFGLKNNPKFKSYRDPLNVLMGVLRKGEVWYEKDYKSAKELAMEKIIERKRAERERIKQLEEKLFLTALEEWKETKSEAELDKLIPPGTIPPRSVKISIYFKENIWPAVKKDYFI